MKFCFRFLIVTFSLLLSALGYAAETAKYNIVFLGDSLTAGYKLSAERAFPAKIQKRVADAGLPWKVINAGVSGDTTAGGLRRLSWIYKNKVDILFVCLGANDGFRMIDVKLTEQNLRNIIERGQKAGSRVILAGMKLPRNFGEEAVKKFDAIFPKIAKDYSLTYIPFLLDEVAMKQQYNQSDAIHPNDAGTELIATNVWKVVEPAMKEVMLKK